MAKKKKTQLKPVARKFATTSIPKKVVETPPPAESPAEVVQESAPIVAEASSTAPSSLPEVKGDGLTPEIQALQALVEKYQDKTEKEIVRTIKVRLHPTFP